MPASHIAVAETASELRLVLGMLVRKLRAESLVPSSHLSVLGRLDRLGPQTTSALAAAERIRPQSMAQTVAELRQADLVTRRPDPEDRRQVLIEMTDPGKKLLREHRRRGVDWLSRAIDDELSPAEQRVLAEAIALLRRLAEL
jgi:DNA-binding MarR family transcriptional regulator